MAEQSPLIEVAMAYAREVCQSPLSPAVSSQLKFAIAAYIQNRMSYEDCATVLQWAVHSTQPLEKLKAILSTPEEPIIFSPSTEEEQSPNTRRKSRPWTEYEDQRLLAGVHKYGLNNWQMVANFIGNGRTRGQTAQKWFRGLDPKISKDHWSKAEEDLLIQLINSAGSRGWTFVAHGMGNRTDVQCRYHFNMMLASRKYLTTSQRSVQFAPQFVPQPQIMQPNTIPVGRQLKPSFSAQILPLVTRQPLIQPPNLIAQTRPEPPSSNLVRTKPDSSPNAISMKVSRSMNSLKESDCLPPIFCSDVEDSTSDISFEDFQTERSNRSLSTSNTGAEDAVKKF